MSTPTFNCKKIYIDISIDISLVKYLYQYLYKYLCLIVVKYTIIINWINYYYLIIYPINNNSIFNNN